MAADLKVRAFAGAPDGRRAAVADFGKSDERIERANTLKDTVRAVRCVPSRVSLGGTDIMAGHYLRAALIFACTVVFAAAQEARADDPDFLSFGGGYFDWNRQKSPAVEFRLEYRSDQKVWVFKPLGGLMGTSDGAIYAYAGVGIDVFFGRRFVVTPSFAPGYYRNGSGLELGHELEFRSQIEFAYRFDNRSRLGMAVSHMSNASIGDTNPGTESAILYYSVPFSNLFGD